MHHVKTFAARSVSAAALAVALLATGLRPAAATPVYGLDNQLFVYALAASPSAAQVQTFQNDTGWIASTSPLTQSFTAAAQYADPGYGLAQAGVTATATVFYGALEASGSGFASPVLNRGGAQANAGPVVGGEPLISYRDQLVVTSTTLPIGTPVAISFSFSFGGTSSFVSAPPPESPSTAEIAAGFTLWNGLGSYDWRFTSPGSYVETSTAAVGSILQIEGALFASGYADSSWPSGDSSFTFSDPTTEFIDVSTPGAFLTAASGHGYSTRRAIAVPEPGALGLFGLGAAFMGLCLLKRRSVRKA